MNQSTKATLAGLAGYAIFGFSFLFTKVALAHITPMALLSVRFIIAFLVMNLLVAAKIIKISLKGKPVMLLLLLGLIQPVLYFIFETYGVALTTSAFSGLMIGLSPVGGLVFGMLLLKEKCTPFQAVCTVLSVVGVSLTSTGGFGNISMVGLFCLLGAVVSAALYAIVSRSCSQHFSAFERTYMMFGLGSIVFTVIALVECRGDLTPIVSALTSGEFVFCLLYLAVLSSIGAFTLLNYALTYTTVGKTLIFSNFATVISILAGIFILGDQFSAQQLIGILVITFSVFGVSWQKPKKTE